MKDKRGYRSIEILFKHDEDLTPVQGKREGRRPLRLQCSSENSSAAWQSLPFQHWAGTVLRQNSRQARSLAESSLREGVALTLPRDGSEGVAAGGRIPTCSLGGRSELCAFKVAPLATTYLQK